MTGNRIRKKIRRLSIRHLICPAIFLIFIIIVIDSFPIYEFFNPVKVDSVDQIKVVFMDGTRHISITTDSLYYTGYDYMQNNEIKGSFYYSIENDRCTYYLLSDNYLGGDTPDVLYNVTLSAKLITGNQVYTKLLENFSKDLSWTTAGLSNVSSKIIVSEFDYSGTKNRFFIITLFILFAFSAVDIVILLTNLILPHSYFNFFKLIKHGSVKKIINEAGVEIDENVVLKTKDIYITDNYFVDLGFSSVNVVPIDKIAWIYEHSRLHKFLFFKYKITSNLYLTDDYKHTFVCQGKNKEDVDAVIDKLSSDHPEILIGYTRENENQLQNSLLGIKRTFARISGKTEDKE